MGQRGPKPKPTALKIFEGNPGQRRLNLHEPKPTPGAPTGPSWLSREAKAEWERVVPELERLGMLTKVDRAELAACCQSWAEYVEAVKCVQAEGTVIEGKRGPQKNPNCTVLNEAWSRFHKAAAVFGLNPSARSQMVAPASDEQSKLEALLNRKTASTPSWHTC